MTSYNPGTVFLRKCMLSDDEFFSLLKPNKRVEGFLERIEPPRIDIARQW